MPLKRKHQNSRKAYKARNDNAIARAHLQWLRTRFTCIVFGDDCGGKIVAADSPLGGARLVTTVPEL